MEGKKIDWSRIRREALNDAFDIYAEALQTRDKEYGRVFWLLVKCRRMLDLLGYDRADILFLRDDFLEWLHEQQPGAIKHSLIDLQDAYDALESQNSIQAIQLGVEKKKVDLNAFNKFLNDRGMEPIKIKSEPETFVCPECKVIIYDHPPLSGCPICRYNEMSKHYRKLLKT